MTYAICYPSEMERTTILIPTDLRRRLVEEARRRRLPQSALIREALERYLAMGRPDRPSLIGAAEVDGVDSRQVKAWARRQWDAKAARRA